MRETHSAFRTLVHAGVLPMTETTTQPDDPILQRVLDEINWARTVSPDGGVDAATDVLFTRLSMFDNRREGHTLDNLGVHVEAVDTYAAHGYLRLHVWTDDDHKRE